MMYQQQNNNEKAKLNEMLKRVFAPNYLIANPFSKLGNEDLNGTMTSRIFFENFHSYSNEYYVHMAEIFNLANNPNMNTVFITGFRGCGKTTFARHLISILSEEETLRYVPDECGSFTQDNENDVATGANELYDEFSVLLDLDPLTNNENAIDANQDHINEIGNGLQGKGIYINFEVGTNSTQHPIEHKLAQNLKKLIIKRVVNANHLWVFSELSKIYSSCKSGFDDFETHGTHYISTVFDYIDTLAEKKDIVTDEVEKEFDKLIFYLSKAQLLLFIVLIDMLLLTVDNYPNVQASDFKKKIFYVFDNIDIIYDTRVLDDFIQDYVFFIENMSRLVSRINECTQYQFSLYDNFVFIFVMRETSSMSISDHFHDRLQFLSLHFDLSDTSDKSKIVQKKHDYLLGNLQQNNNRRLFRSVHRINQICSDPYIRRNIFPMFNNDYKRSMSCLSEIIDRNIKEIEDFLHINSNDVDYCKRGARGIIFRLIFKHFKKNGYFDDIGLTNANLAAYKLTPSRLILTYLANIQIQQNPHFLQNDNDEVQLTTLYNNFQNIFSDNSEENLNAFLNAIWGMFELRTSHSWNHLITFDAIKHISFNEVSQQLLNPSINKTPIKIRLTCAGRNYIRFMCVHFEFFGTRFSNIKYPLFSSACSTFIPDRKKYYFELVMEDVFNAVEKCCENLDATEHRAFIASGRYDIYSFLQSYFCYKNPDNANSYFHLERIIHNHIGYIDDYRLYLINYVFTGNVVDINKRIIKIIKKYVALLIKYPYVEEKNRDLIQSFNECIQSIEDSKYESVTIRIART